MKTTCILLLLVIVCATTSCSKSDDQVVLQSITFKDDTLTLIQGTSQQLVPVFTPTIFSTIPVEWSSSDATHVSVSSTGIISTVSSGSAWITIKDKYSATRGKCLVIVM